MHQDKTYCVLLETKYGRRRDKSQHHIHRGAGSSLSDPVKTEVLPGSLLYILDKIESRGNASFLALVNDEDIEVECKQNEFERISDEEFNLLRPIPTCGEKWTVFMEKAWLRDGRILQQGDHVHVQLKGFGDATAIIRYKGLVSTLPGTYFGIELLEHRGQGTSDGVFRNNRYFTCDPDCAMFVALHRLRKKPDRAPTPSGSIWEVTTDCGLSIGDRVVWVSDSGPESGTVRWLGILPDTVRNEITVGVDFDNPVGTGTGKYRDRRLFYSKQNHASLVPILGLVKEEVMYGYANPPAVNHNDDEYMLQVEMQNQPIEAGNAIKTQDEIWKQAKRDIQAPRKPASSSMPEKYPPNQLNDNGKLKARTWPVEGVNPLYEYENNKSEQKNEEHMFEQFALQKPYNRRPIKREVSVGSVVEVLTNPPLYGVVRWIGPHPTQDGGPEMAGLEMEDESAAGTDGTFQQSRYFHCSPHKALFVPLHTCKQDKRFQENRAEGNKFGGLETPDVKETIAPPNSLGSLATVCGKNKGIQGHHNSCYLDATLVAMFFFTTVFDFILYRPRKSDDIPEYSEVQRVLKEGIVNPLRKFFYVRADKVLKLRSLMDKLGSIPGMMTEEKDPEEFLSSLLKITKADPFLHLNSGDSTSHANLYQLFIEKDERLVLPTAQQLFELSFLQSHVKLEEIPACLILQMPRFGKDYKMYRRIVPSLELDITDVLEYGPRECIICGDLAVFECKECYQIHGAGLNTIAFCDGCKRTSHQHKARVNHRPNPIKVRPQFKQHLAKARASDSLVIYREKLELFAVVCIETSHYVSFVKCRSGKEAPWVFFDSMADRIGEQSGHNIPEVTHCPDIPMWLSEEYQNNIISKPNDKDLPEHMKRLLCDAYMCMYLNPHVSRFK